MRQYKHITTDDNITGTKQAIRYNSNPSLQMSFFFNYLIIMINLDINKT